MGLEQHAATFCPLDRRRFLAVSAGLGAALLLPAGVRAAEVRQLEGSVKVNGKNATRTTRVRAGDSIATGPKSKLVFVIGQDAFLLRGQSQLKLDKSKDGTAPLISGLRLVTGALLAAFGKGPRTIETPTATAGIRGTAVYIEASAGQTYFCTCYGEVDLRDKARSAHKLVVSGYHTPNIVFAHAVDGKMMVPATVRGHADDELIMLEKLVGRTSPIMNRDRKLKEGTEPAQPETQAPAQPNAEAPAKAEAPSKMQASPKAEPPPQPQAVPQPSAAEPARAPSPTLTPEPMTPAKPETPPAQPEYRLPPARLDDPVSR